MPAPDRPHDAGADAPDPTDGNRFAGLFARMQDGDERARDEVYQFVYAELKAIAKRNMRQQSDRHTLQPTALVHEAYLRLSGAGTVFRSRGHLIAVCAQAMRQVLVDHARRKAAHKRTPPGPLDAVLRHYEQASIDVLALHEGLQRLAERDAVAATLVEQRFLGGASVEECADQLQIPVHQAYRRLRSARAFLRLHVEGDAELGHD
ncbi:MAG: ECF-type sigma factor [Planctomycetota bacterium]